MQSTPTWIREFEHTGDAGIAVEAADLDTLFARAAWGLFDVLVDLAAVVPREAREISVEAGDLDALLVRWLSELNFIHATEGWLFCSFVIRRRTDHLLVAEARGERYDPDRHTIYTEVKAVTFHGLCVEREGNVWRARIIFDL